MKNCNCCFSQLARYDYAFYVITSGDFLKIGVTGNMHQRLSQIQHASPTGAKLIGWISFFNDWDGYEPMHRSRMRAREKAFKTESGFKRILTEFRSHGEWYYNTEERCALERMYNALTSDDPFFKCFGGKYHA